MDSIQELMQFDPAVAEACRQLLFRVTIFHMEITETWLIR